MTPEQEIQVARAAVDGAMRTYAVDSRTGDALAHLATLYLNQGRYAEAEIYFQRAYAIHRRFSSLLSGKNVGDLLSLGALYVIQGRLNEAVLCFQTVLKEEPKGLLASAALSQLAMVYYMKGNENSADADRVFQQAQRMAEQIGKEDSLLEAMGTMNLSLVFWVRSQYDKAERTLLRSLAAFEKAHFTDSQPYVICLGALGKLAQIQGRFDDAEKYFDRARKLGTKLVPPDDPWQYSDFLNQATLAYARNRPDQAGKLFEQSSRLLNVLLESSLPYMSEKSRLTFLNGVREFFSAYYSFCFTNGKQRPELAGKMYDLVLRQKGLVVNSIAALRAQVAATGDAESLVLLGQIASKKDKVARITVAATAERDKLALEVAALEEKLAARSGRLAERKQLQDVSWQSVRNALGREEAAVEFVKFAFHDGRRLTDKNYYAALVVTAETTNAPVLVSLGDAAILEAAPINEYNRTVDRHYNRDAAIEPGFYVSFWKPLEPYLAGKKRIYVSPDGVLNQVSLATVSDEHDRLLIEKYDLRILSSTKDLLRERQKPSNDLAVLIGNPRFSLDESALRLAAAQLHAEKGEQAPLATSAVAGMRSSGLRGEALEELPGTGVEISAVRNLLQARRWKVEVFSREQALEEAVKRTHNPRLLLIATHGFFEPDQQPRNADWAAALFPDRPSGLEEPMLRSGLFLSGANRVQQNLPLASDLDDGVLTAYEASELNLHGTELVVMSACESGLGSSKNGEGVFGLRRAFQEAGAEAVMMSMWKVPDEDTQELMTLFYTKWLAGMDKHDALREAQLELRKKIMSSTALGNDDPRRWGAFVLVGR